MSRSLPAFSRASMTVLALLYPGLASAQIWSSPKVVANGSSIAVSTNGTGSAAVMFTPMSAVVQSGGTWGSPVVLSNLGPYGNGSGNIAVAPNGDVLAVWSFRSTNTYTPSTAQAAFFTGGHWGRTITISSHVYGNVSSFGVPSIGFDGASKATLVWEEITNPSPMTCALKAVTGTAANGFEPAQTISSSGT